MKPKAHARPVTAAARSTVRPPVTFILCLFVAGATTRSREAIRHVRQLCADGLAGGGRLEVVDIYQQPQLARLNQIVATPTLIRKSPRPERRFVGSLAKARGLGDGPAALLARILL